VPHCAWWILWPLYNTQTTKFFCSSTCLPYENYESLYELQKELLLLFKFFGLLLWNQSCLRELIFQYHNLNESKRSMRTWSELRKMFVSSNACVNFHIKVICWKYYKRCSFRKNRVTIQTNCVYLTELFHLSHFYFGNSS